MKYITIFLLSIFVCVGHLQAATLVVVKDLVNIRQAPDLESAILVRVNQGQRLQEIQKQGRWYEVQPEGISQITGWVNSSLVERIRVDCVRNEPQSYPVEPDKEVRDLPKNDRSPLVAKMSDVVLSYGELNDFLNLLDGTARKKAAGNVEVFRNLVREEVVRKKIVQEALASGFHRLPRVEQFIERARTQTIADRFLQEQAKAPDDFPSEAEIQAQYERNKAKYTTPQQVHIAQIFFNLPEAGDEKAKEALFAKVTDVFKQALSAESDFASLAALYSEQSGAAQKGGGLGWLTMGEVAPGMRKVFAEMQIGTVSPPYLSAQGWHIFQLTDRRDEVVSPLSEVADEIRDDMRRTRMLENRDRYLKNLLDKEEIFIDEELLKNELSGMGV